MSEATKIEKMVVKILRISKKLANVSLTSMPLIPSSELLLLREYYSNYIGLL